jgi:hypothetical protein
LAVLNLGRENFLVVKGKGPKHNHIKWLEGMGSVRWIYNQEDLVLEAVGDENIGKVTAMAIKDKHPPGTSGFLLCISVKYILEPIQAHLIITLSSR